MNRLLTSLNTKRMRKRVAWGMGLILLYVILGFFILPPILRAVAVRQLTQQLNRPASIQQVRINPLTLSLTVKGLAVKERNDQPFVSWDELYANFQLSSLFRWAWTFDEIQLREPRIRMVLEENGRFNFADLLTGNTNDPPPQTASDEGLPRLLVFNLVITNGHFGFEDLSRRKPFRTSYEPFHIHLTRFTTRRDRSSPYSLAASSELGGRLAWEGQVTAHPPASRGALRMDGIQLTNYTPFLEEFTRAQLAEGRLDVAGGYHFAWTTNGLDLVVSNLAVKTTELTLQDPGPGETVLVLAACELRAGQLDWRARQARAGSLLVNAPRVVARRRADGSINLLSLALPRSPRETAPSHPPSDSAPAAPPWIVALDDFRIEGGMAEWEDAAVAPPFRTTLQPVSLRLEHFTTAPEKEAALRASLLTEAVEGMELAADYTLTPPRASGRLKVAGVELKKYQPYLAPFFRGRIASGKTDAALEFAVRRGTDTNEMIVSNGVVRLSNLHIQPPQGDETWVQLPSLSVENASASLGERLFRVGALKSAGASILARRETNGAINLLSLLATNPPSPEPASRPSISAALDPGVPNGPRSAPALSADTSAFPASAGWRAVLEELALKDYTVRLEDQQLPVPGALTVDQLALHLRDFQFPSNAPVHVDVAARLNGAGAITVGGSMRPYHPSADLNVELAHLDMSKFQPWIERQMKLALNRGTLNLKGRVKLDAPDGAGPWLRWDGDVAITRLLAADQVLFKELAGWEEFAINDLNLSIRPNQLSARQARFVGLRSSVILGPDQRPTFLSIWPDASGTNAATARLEAASAPKSTGGPAPSIEDSFPIQIEELAFEQAALHFEDQSIQPHCAFDVRQFSGAIQGLSSKPDSTASIDVSGMVDESSPFGLRGRINPLASPLVLHLTFTNHNLQLTPFTPYMEKFGGYPLNKGRLSLALEYILRDQALQAENKVSIDQLMLGPRNHSPDAVQLPVKLAVALLKDNQGRIELDLPVQGRLDDPQFKIAPILFKVLANLIVKTAASPFKLLGSLVGGGEEMSYVEFAPGSAFLADSETNKLDKLIGALEKRPALSLEIEGSVHPVADRDELARGLVREHLKTLRLKEISSIGRALPREEALQLDPADSERLLRARLIETFGAGLAEAIRALAAPEAGTNRLRESRSAAQNPSLFKRWLSIFKPRQERAAILQAHRHLKADEMLLQEHPELAGLTIADMELLLARKTEVPPDNLRQLTQERAKAVQAYLLNSGKITADRLFLVTAKTPDASSRGESRVILTLN